MLHYEVDRTATFPATEAFADAFGAGNVKRWRALIVKRAETHVA